MFTCILEQYKCMVSHLCGCANVHGTCENFQNFVRTPRTYWIWVRYKNGRQILSTFSDGTFRTLDVHFHVWSRDVFEIVGNFQMTRSISYTSTLVNAHHDNAEKLENWLIKYVCINKIKKCLLFHFKTTMTLRPHTFSNFALSLSVKMCAGHIIYYNMIKTKEH